MIQRRLQQRGVPMIVLPVELDLARAAEQRPPGAFPGARLLAEVTELPRAAGAPSR